MKLNSLNKNANSKQKENSQSNKDSSGTNNRSRRPIKKTKEDSFTSDINDDYDEDNAINSQSNNTNTNNGTANHIQISNPNYNEAETDDVIMEGNFIYRYSLDQIELEGYWSLSSSYSKDKFSYLFIKKTNLIQIPVPKTELDLFHHHPPQNQTNQEVEDNNINKDYEKYLSLNKEKVYINLCSGNIFEILLIPNQTIFNSILDFLTGEYHGYFVYFGKTIEDKFNLNFFFEDNQVRLTGEGTNNLGDFNIIGYVNFYTIKEQLVNDNNIDSDVIKFGMIKITRIYNAFNENEKIRVIKSYQHSRKKYDEDY